MIHEYFPEEYLLLQRELQYHPQLLFLLAKHPGNEPEIMMAEIASYCGIILDGVYVPEEMARLAGIMYKMLKDKREEGPAIVLN